MSGRIVAPGQDWINYEHAGKFTQMVTTQQVAERGKQLCMCVGVKIDTPRVRPAESNTIYLARRLSGGQEIK